MAASGTSGAGRSATTNLLGSEVMGSVSAYKVGGVHRHTPGDRAGPAVGPARTGAGLEATISFTPMLAPMPRGILATCTARPATGSRARPTLRDALAARLRRRAVRPPAARRAVARTPPPPPARTRAHLQVVGRPDSGRASWSCRAIDNLGKGAAGQAVQNANLMLGLPETAGLTADGSRAVSVTAAAGFRAAGVAAGLKASGDRDVAAGRQRRPVPTPRPPCSPRNRVKAAPVLWTQQVVTGGRVRAVVLNSGGANACTGPAASRHPRAPPSGVAAALADSAPARWRSAPPA